MSCRFAALTHARLRLPPASVSRRFAAPVHSIATRSRCAGLGLVFKTNMRWAFFALGFVIFVGSTIYMVTLPWTA